MRQIYVAALLAIGVVMLAPDRAAFSRQGASMTPPAADISNGELRAKLYLPDAQRGFYRSTRFDWSGVIASLELKGHQYYGPWFTGSDPSVRDFVYRDADIL